MRQPRPTRKIHRGCDCDVCRSRPSTLTGKRAAWNQHDGGRRVRSLELLEYGSAYGGERKEYRQRPRILRWN